MTYDTDKYQTIAPDPSEFEVQWDSEHLFHFFESEDGDIVCGYGHQDRSAFADEVNQYDKLVDFEPDRPYIGDDVDHRYAIALIPTDKNRDDVDYWQYELVPEGTADSFPVTIIER